MGGGGVPILTLPRGVLYVPPRPGLGFPPGRDLGIVTGVPPPGKDMGPVEVLWDGDEVPPRKAMRPVKVLWDGDG